MQSLVFLRLNSFGSATSVTITGLSLLPRRSPQNARYRIGLSATPEHYLDEERNARLKAYYGEIVFSYTLKQAIEDKVLTPYNYHPRLVELTLPEAEEFIALSDEIARQFARDQGQAGGKPSIGLTALLMKRSRIVGVGGQ